MKFDAYKIIGINEAKLQGGEQEYGQNQTDRIIKTAYRQKLNGINQRINETLSNSDTSTEKMKKINKILKQYIFLKIAFDKIKTQGDREKNKINGEQAILTDLEAVIKKFEAAKLLEQRKKHFQTSDDKLGTLDGIRHTFSEQREMFPSTAYQVLAITPNDQVTDSKVQIKALTLIKESTSKVLLTSIKENEKMLDTISKYIWAYSKLSTSDQRRIYNVELSMNTMLQNVERLIPAMGTVVRRKKTDPISADIVDSENDELLLRVTERGKLLVKEFMHEEDAINQYAVDRFVYGEPVQSAIIYSNIDVERLQNDVAYQGAVRGMLTDERIQLSRKYMAGYVGELEYNQGDWKTVYNTENIAACEKRKREKIAQKAQKQAKNNASQTHEDPNDGEQGGH